MPDRPPPTPLLDAFGAAFREHAERRAPSTPLGAAARFGWGTNQIAAEFGVSTRTARRWRQHNRVPLARQADWRATMQGEQERRMRARIERAGIKSMTVTGEYRISRSRYRARSGAPIRFGGPNAPLADGRITGAQMREVFAAADQGNMIEAEGMLNDALGQAYGAPGLSVDSVDSLNYSMQ